MTSSSKTRVGILQAGHTPDQLMNQFGDFDKMFKKLLGEDAFSYTSYDVNGGHFPNDPNENDAWLITGSRHSVYEDLPWIEELSEFIRLCYKSDRPIVGICFGHQLLAQALGGKVEKFDRGWSIGANQYQIDGTDQSITVNAWHQDQVVELPKDAERIGHSDFCENALLRYGNKALSIQAHPEFQTPFCDALIDLRDHTLDPKLVQNARQSSTDNLDRDFSSKLISDFLRGREVSI